MSVSPKAANEFANYLIMRITAQVLDISEDFSPHEAVAFLKQLRNDPKIQDQFIIDIVNDWNWRQVTQSAVLDTQEHDPGSGGHVLGHRG